MQSSFVPLVVNRARLSRAISRIRYRDTRTILDCRHIKKLRRVCHRTRLFRLSLRFPKKAPCFADSSAAFKLSRAPESFTETNPRAVKSREFFPADATHVYLAFNVYNAMYNV